MVDDIHMASGDMRSRRAVRLNLFDDAALVY